MLRQLKPALLSVITFTFVLGIAFPLAFTALARLVFPRQAEGSLIRRDGRVIGSRLIGQTFTSPRYFHSRPSAAGSGYDATASGGTNLGPTSDKLIHGIHRKLPDGSPDPGNFEGIQDLAVRYRLENRLAAGTPVPADAVTRSASGLDPDISPANAALQIARVAAARGIPEDGLRRMVLEHTTPRQFGFLGEPRVNVLELNLALEDSLPARAVAGS